MKARKAQGGKVKEKKMVSMLRRKTSLLLKFRGYSIKGEADSKDFKDIVAVRRGEEGRILIRVMHRTPLLSGKVGVQDVRKMKDKLVKEGFNGGILIGRDFSYSAGKEARSYGVEVISEGRIPTFDIFDHGLVPKHEILAKQEAEELLQRYHAEPYRLPKIKASDPAAFLIGAKPGDILRITRESPTAGTHVTFRYVVQWRGQI